MCFDFDSLPPIPVLSGAAVSHDDLVLEADDGNRLAAFSATPDDPSGAGIVILPDVRGLYRFYEELALRFAERGHAAIAIDYFGRTAGVEKRGETSSTCRTSCRRRRRRCRPTSAAAVARLRSDGATSVFTVGFCFGGRNSWLAAAGGHGLAGAVGFYGRPAPGATARPGRRSAPPSSKAPILALMGGADEASPSRTWGRSSARWRRPASSTRSSIYDGAPHSFFDRKFEEFADASADAWHRTLAFVEQHTESDTLSFRAVSNVTADTVSWWQRARGEDDDLLVAYFSMEFGIHERLPIYSGGLGVLAGDHLKAAAELGVPLVGVGLLYTGGYFRQGIDKSGRQTEDYQPVDPEAVGLVREDVSVTVDLAGETIEAGVWRKDVASAPASSRSTCSRSTGSLTRSTAATASSGSARSCCWASAASARSAALGIEPNVFHLNEGHSSFLS